MTASRSTTELGNKLQTRANNAPAAPKPQNEGLKSFLAAPAIKKRFEEVLDKRAPQFMSSMLNLSRLLCWILDGQRLPALIRRVGNPSA
ncbi:hypothetical protein [Paenibacillus sp. P22]|uniref:hypothetical protein n=1 Tax=Paenibacillus sp. P22 TaxID=483908 RepID=UPI0004353005|nr:hypothetical protein [Paenibacillus sp. P22]CDN43730.1 hypothetical protein BN871_DK_00020 [Paenibacillus sp. P22]